MPRVVDRAERLGEIATAVRSILERDGVEHVTMRNVAAELSCTTGLLTHWVADRAALLHVAMRATVDDQTARAVAAMQRSPDDITAAAEEFLPLDDARRADQKVWFGFWALAISDPVLGAEHRDRYRGIRARMVEWFGAQGLVRADARAATDHLMTSVDGVAVSAIFDPEHWTPARQRRHLRAVVAGVLE
jgi:AcrR family transcriptional regulator